MLNIYDELPVGLLECEASELHQILPGPALIHLPGRQPQPLFLSVLLHGNESTGWDAVRRILREYQGQTLPRALSLFIGNVAAAAKGLRHLDGQPDYNRIWKADSDRPEDVMVRQVLESMRERDVFACIDIHNNSGRNPHYACVNRLAAPFFDLATEFSRTVVYFIQPDSVLSMAFAGLCPAVTIECGKPGDMQGIEAAYEFILSTLRRQQLAEEGSAVSHIDVYHTVAIVKLNPGISVGQIDKGHHIELKPDVDQLNFRELPPGTPLASVRPGSAFPVRATNEFGKDVTDRYFDMAHDQLLTRTNIMPSMLTLELDIIQQDCLCYLMERLDLAHTLST